MQNDTTRHGIGGNNPAASLNDIQSPLMSLQHAMRYLGISKSTFYLRMAEGEFEIARFCGRSLVTRRSLDDYIARNIVAPKAAATKPTTGRVPRPIKRKLVPGKQQKREARPPL